jgi:hypothetical protein
MINCKAIVPMNCLKVLSNGDIRIQLDIDGTNRDIMPELTKMSGDMVSLVLMTETEVENARG